MRSLHGVYCYMVHFLFLFWFSCEILDYIYIYMHVSHIHISCLLVETFVRPTVVLMASAIESAAPPGLDSLAVSRVHIY